MSSLHRIKPGQLVKLSELPADGKELHDDRDKAEKEFKKNRDAIAEIQPRLYAEHQQKLLIIFQAMDAGGKDSTTRHVFKGVNPQGVQVASFKAPTTHELDRDFLWRIHREVPAKGMIGIFNRSQYEDVLIVRVDGLVSEDEWRTRYKLINQFEELLHETGTRILKFYLHITKEEQKEQFQERLDEPEKHWKFSRQDLEKRKQWDQYREAYEEALSRCSPEHAPWYVIPANQNWYRDWAVSKIIRQTLEEMNPQYPSPEPDLDKVVIE